MGKKYSKILDIYQKDIPLLVCLWGTHGGVKGLLLASSRGHLGCPGWKPGQPHVSPMP